MATPLQMAREHCANHRTLEHPKMSGCIWDAKGHCRLTKKGVRCSYFETAVLPLANRVPPNAHGRYAEIPRLYWQSVAQKTGVGLNALNVTLKEVRRCACGTALGYRQKQCKSCRVKRRREAHRRYNRQRRKKRGPDHDS